MENQFIPSETKISQIVIPNNPPFIIDSMVHEAATVLYGRPEAGKSFYALSIADAVTKGSPWLQRNSRRGRVLFVALDPGQVNELKRRWDLIPGGADFTVWTSRPEHSDGWWREFATHVQERFDLVILDNLTRLIPPGGSVRNDEHVRIVLDRLDMLIDARVAVLLIHHAGKPGEDGNPRTSPMGATAIESWARHFIRVDRKRGTRLSTLHSEGNDVEPFELTTLHVPEGDGKDAAFFTITGGDKPDKSRRRSESRWDDASRIAMHVHFSGEEFKSLSAVATWLEDNPPEDFPPARQEAWKKRLQRQVFPAGLLDGGKGRPVVAGKALLEQLQQQEAA